MFATNKTVMTTVVLKDSSKHNVIMKINTSYFCTTVISFHFNCLFLGVLLCHESFIWLVNIVLSYIVDLYFGLLA